MLLIPICMLAVAGLASASSTPTRTLRSINPDVGVLTSKSLNLSARGPRPETHAQTNGKRLALGLPLMKPRHRSGKAARAGPSCTALISQTCNIRVAGTDGTQHGYINPSWNTYNEYGILQQYQFGALAVSFSYSQSQSCSSQLDLKATNGPSTEFTFFGAIVGDSSASDDFATESYNYAVLGGTMQSTTQLPSAGANSFTDKSGVAKNYESAVWNYDPNTQAITPQWTNSDGSAPATHIIYENGAGASDATLVITGDVSAFQAQFGLSYSEVTFTCVPPSSNSNPTIFPTGTGLPPAFKRRHK